MSQAGEGGQPERAGGEVTLLLWAPLIFTPIPHKR